jgi:hypothetical protein
MSLNFNLFWDDQTGAAGVTDAEIASWERTHGVTLPALLREALKRHNGGIVRNTSLRIYSLSAIAPEDEGFWEWASFDEENFAERRLVMPFAEDCDTGGVYLLNFNANGPAGEPEVCVWHSDPGDLGQAAASLAEILGPLMAVADGPSVDWNEIRLHEIVAEETIEFGGAAAMEQVLCRNGRMFLLFTRRTAPEGHELSQTAFLGPLHAEGAMITPTLANTAFWLHIAPTETHTIVHETSERTADGAWKNRESQGVPVYVVFMSRDKAFLENLRARLFSIPVVRTLTEREATQAEVLKRMHTMDPDERKAMGMEMLRQMHAQTSQTIDRMMAGAGVETMSAASQAMKQLLDQAVERSPTSADAKELVQRYVQSMRTPGADEGDSKVE